MILCFVDCHLFPQSSLSTFFQWQIFKVICTSEQSKITGFMTYCDKFPHAYLKWVVMTYQPINACENPSFQEMCLTMKGKAPVLGRDKVQKLLSEECATMKVEIRHILSG